MDRHWTRQTRVAKTEIVIKERHHDNDQQQ
jgi:hypothetical protein